MARTPQDINPEDKFPQRNLPDPAEPWGRTMEDRVIAIEKAIKAQESFLQGTNRSLAASMSNMGERIERTFKVLQGSLGYAWEDIAIGTGSGLSERNNMAIDPTISPDLLEGFNRAAVSVTASLGGKMGDSVFVLPCNPYWKWSESPTRNNMTPNHVEGFFPTMESSSDTVYTSFLFLGNADVDISSPNGSLELGFSAQLFHSPPPVSPITLKAYVTASYTAILYNE